MNLNNLKICVDGHTYDCYDENAERPAWLDGNLKLDEGTGNQLSGSIQLINFGDRELINPSTLEIKVGTVTEQEHYIPHRKIHLRWGIFMITGIHGDAFTSQRSV